jgi:hypothetical protein
VTSHLDRAFGALLIAFAVTAITLIGRLFQ